MRQYIIKRVIISFIVLIGVSIMLYAITRMMPSDFVELSTANNENHRRTKRTFARIVRYQYGYY